MQNRDNPSSGWSSKKYSVYRLSMMYSVLTDLTPWHPTPPNCIFLMSYIHNLLILSDMIIWFYCSPTLSFILCFYFWNILYSKYPCVSTFWSLMCFVSLSVGITIFPTWWSNELDQQTVITTDTQHKYTTTILV